MCVILFLPSKSVQIIKKIFLQYGESYTNTVYIQRSVVYIVIIIVRYFVLLLILSAASRP